jgi:hypothetical protein
MAALTAMFVGFLDMVYKDVSHDTATMTGCRAGIVERKN